MPESNEERMDRAHRMAQNLFGDMGYSRAHDYAEDMVSKVELYELKTFWMLVRQDLVKMNNPVSAAEPKYRIIGGQTTFKEGIL